jgi:hypothetical protein
VAKKLELFDHGKNYDFKRNRYGLGYEKDADNLFHIPNYKKPICFVSGGFLNDDKKTELEDIGKEQVHDIVDDDVATDI